MLKLEILSPSKQIYEIWISQHKYVVVLYYVCIKFVTYCHFAFI